MEAHVDRLRAATSSAMLAGLIGGFLVVALLISGTLQAGTRLSNWDSAYPLLIGNEQTGDRPWRGRVFALEITDAATPAASVRRFSAGESVVLPGRRWRCLTSVASRRTETRQVICRTLTGPNIRSNPVSPAPH